PYRAAPAGCASQENPSCPPRRIRPQKVLLRPCRRPIPVRLPRLIRQHVHRIHPPRCRVSQPLQQCFLRREKHRRPLAIGFLGAERPHSLRLRGHTTSTGLTPAHNRATNHTSSRVLRILIGRF